MDINAFEFLALQCEKDEIQAAVEGLGLLQAKAEALGRNSKDVVKLKRTFNQKDMKGKNIKFWRVTAPEWHPRFHSDLSLWGLREAGIIR